MASLLKDEVKTKLASPEYDYTPGYYAVYFYDPDGIRLELLHRRTYWEWLRRTGDHDRGGDALKPNPPTAV